MKSLHYRGIFGSITYVFRKLKLKLRFRNFDFWGLIDPKELDGLEEVKIHAARYEASDHYCFKKLFKKVDWDYTNSTFVDFGCGKGASLVYAYEIGFRKLIGVEYSRTLAETATDNLQKFSDQKIGAVNFEIKNMDAAKYEIPIEADCFYFFNPFDAYILDKVLQNITKSLELRGRKIMIVYMNALHNTIFENYDFEEVMHLSANELNIHYLGGGYVYKNGFIA